MDTGFIKKDILMRKLLIILSAISFVPLSFAVSLGDTLNEQNMARTNTTTSAMKLVSHGDKFSTYQDTSSDSTQKILVNNSTNHVYSISWDGQLASLGDILGSTYYPKFQAAAKNPQMRIPRRAISIDDGDLSVHQFGSMAAGMHGMATVKSLAPQ
jgi:hypothetical protein